MTRTLRYAIVATLLLVIAIFWLRRDTTQPVEVEQLKVADAALDLSVSGRVRVQERLTLAPQQAGRVSALLVNEGDTVQAGQLIARITMVALPEQRMQAQALRQQAAVQLAQIERDLQRDRALQQQGFLSAAALDKQRAARDQAAAALAAADASIKELAARDQEAQLRAPIAGVIAKRLVEPGATVDSRNGVVTLIGTGGSDIEADIDEALADQIAIGTPARLLWQGKRVEGAVSYLAPEVDTASGGRLIRIRPAEAVSAPAGRSIEAVIRVATVKSAITVPRSALLLDQASQTSDQQQADVLVLQDGQALRRRIAVRDWPAERLVVLAGLRSGEQLILSPRTVPKTKLRAVVKP